MVDPIAFVDVETTGANQWGHIIEIGILRIENNTLVDSYSTLINPHRNVDPFILSMTGISQDELEKAPTFADVTDRLLEILKDAVFMAHNVGFDYSYFRREFERIGIRFNAKHLCTAKLARRLFPGHRHYNLDSIIERFGLSCPRRHRAFDDARVLWDFWQKSYEVCGSDRVIEVLQEISKHPSLPISLDKSELDTLPEAPGVYMLYSDEDTPLYIGKSINIRERVLSHFSANEGVDVKISQQIKHIETIITAGELSALVLESELIKQKQPLYNRKLRNRHHLMMAIERKNSGGYKYIEPQISSNIDIRDLPLVRGVFPSQTAMKTALVKIAYEYELCPKLLGLEKPKGMCFATQLGQCHGACMGKEDQTPYNARFDRAFMNQKIMTWPYTGPIVIKEEGQMEEGFVVDSWCLLGKVLSDEEVGQVLEQSPVFDYDVYKILQTFLIRKKSRNIRVYQLHGKI